MSTSQKRFVDTNIFIYSIFPETGEKSHSRCKALFEEAQKGTLELWTTDLVIFEIFWFLDKMKLSWDEIRESLQKIFSTKNLEVRGKALLEYALSICDKNRDFYDVVNIALARSEGIKKGYSYDKGLDKIKGFHRLEP